MERGPLFASLGLPYCALGPTVLIADSEAATTQFVRATLQPSLSPRSSHTALDGMAHPWVWRTLLPIIPVMCRLALLIAKAPSQCSEQRASLLHR